MPPPPHHSSHWQRLRAQPCLVSRFLSLPGCGTIWQLVKPGGTQGPRRTVCFVKRADFQAPAAPRAPCLRHACPSLTQTLQSRSVRSGSHKRCPKPLHQTKGDGYPFPKWALLPCPGSTLKLLASVQYYNYNILRPGYLFFFPLRKVHCGFFSAERRMHPILNPGMPPACGWTADWILICVCMCVGGGEDLAPPDVSNQTHTRPESISFCHSGIKVFYSPSSHSVSISPERQHRPINQDAEDSQGHESQTSSPLRFPSHPGKVSSQGSRWVVVTQVGPPGQPALHILNQLWRRAAFSEPIQCQGLCICHSPAGSGCCVTWTQKAEMIIQAGLRHAKAVGSWYSSSHLLNFILPSFSP
jgi:hypothetical protein